MTAKAFLFLPLLIVVSGCERSIPVRTVTYEEEISVPAQKDAVRLWIPVPQSDANQQVRVVSVESSAPYRRIREKEFGNTLIYVEGKSGEALRLTLISEVDRRLRRGGRLDGPEFLSASLKDFYTRPRGLVEVDDRIRALADKHGGEGSPVEISRRFYDYILEFMVYDKKEPGWGRGDSLRACVVGLGNCTDFHSLFQAMASAKGIPSRFRMGLPLGPGPVQVFEGKGYHCWVDFHAEGRGWIPMDISEAWKVKNGKKEMDPAWAERYFGTLDEDRILLSSGRALTLEPPQAGPRLNYFAYPYAESAGKPLDAVSFKRTIRDRS